MNKELQTAISVCSEWFDMKPKTISVRIPDGRIIRIDGTLYLISAIIFKFDSGNFVKVDPSKITNHIVRHYYVSPTSGSSIDIPAYLEYKILDSVSI